MSHKFNSITEVENDEELSVVITMKSEGIKRVQLVNGDIWEIVKQTLTAVRLPGAKPDDHTQEVKFVTISDFLRNSGYKGIRQLSEYAISFEEIMPFCPKCNRNRDVIKSGRQNKSRSKHRRFNCNNCDFRFTVDYS